MQMRRFSPVMVLLLAAVGVLVWGATIAPAHATPRTQPGDPLRYGQTVSGEITEAEPCRYYTFTGTAGDPVEIDMTRTSGNLDGYLWLYQGDGGWQPDGTFTQTPVAENDDRPDGSLDPLVEITLQVSATYTIAACRLQAERMTVTTGTFDLTLSGPDAPLGPTATPVDALSSGLFGDNNATPTPVPTTSSPLFGTLTDDNPPELGDGVTVNGALSADLTHVRYTLPVVRGDHVTLTLTRTSGDFAPSLRVMTASETEVAATATPEQVGTLVLSFTVSEADAALFVDVGRYGGANDGTAGDYTLAVTVVPGTGAVGGAEEVQSTLEPAPEANYLANPCTTGDQAVSGITSTATLIDVYTAAGDSYYADQLTRTEVFRTDDDLNVVFRVQNVDQTVTVAGLFCAPDGTFHDAGDSTLEVGGPYLLGVDWEYEGVLWPTGDWYVEIYVNGVIETVVAFTVN